MARDHPDRRQPGAREAGCIDFVDRYLSGIGYIYAKPDGSGFETSWRRARPRHGSSASRSCAAAMSTASLTSTLAPAHGFGADFVALTPEQQDEILRGEKAGTGEPTTPRQRALAGPVSPEPALQQTSTETELDFLPLLVMHTRQGFYADPIYGGNRDRVGWEVIGFPGPASLKEVITGRYTTLALVRRRRSRQGQGVHDGV